MAGLVRRQHVVSNFYLKGFADVRNQIKRVELPGTRSYTLATNDASVVKDFYTVTLPDGKRSDYFERLFSEVEGRACEAFKSVIQDHEWPLPKSKRDAMASWIALQYLRSEGIRNSQTQSMALLIRVIVGTSGKEALRELIARAEDREVGDTELDQEWRDITKPGGPDLIADPNDHLRSLTGLWGPTVAMLLARTWTLYRFKRRSLLTSDHPVSLEVDQNYPQHMGVGLATADAVVVPLGRKVGLMIGKISDKSVPEFVVPGNTQIARAFIRMSIRNARRYVYHHPEDDVINGVELPSPNPEEIYPGAGEELIREEGLYAGLWAKPGQAAPPAPSPKATGRERDGLTINDIPWPIPNRRRRFESGS